jgi:hypothetical protein
MSTTNSRLPKPRFLPRIREAVRRDPSLLVYAFLTAAGIAVVIWWLIQRNATASLKPEAAEPNIADVLELVDAKAIERARRAKFFEAQVIANLENADSANRLAAKRCVQRIQSNFQAYRGGVDGFVDELLGIKSRFGILKRMPGGWWREDDRVGKYITEKFERHLFSEAKLSSDLREALEQFREDVRANHRELLSRTQAAVAQSDLPPINVDDYDSFFSAVNKQISSMASVEAKTSVSDGLVTLVVSEAGSAAVGMIAGRLITSIGTSTAAAVAASGGATAGTAAAGAASGSVVPGAGTIVGFGVGLVIGFGIDYWMTNQTASELRTELMLYINAIESDLLLGPISDNPEEPAIGIEKGMVNACDQLQEGVHQRLYEIIVLEQTL